MTRYVQPTVQIIGRPQIDVDAIASYLDEIGGSTWVDRLFGIEGTHPSDGEALAEFAGRLCYRSWTPGLNANVTKVREDSHDYLANVLGSRHGSVTEHAFYVFLFANVSRVFTHELVRHRVGVSISQESMRFVRLTDIPIWIPEWAQQDAALIARIEQHLADAENLQLWMADHFGLDDPGVPFGEKKHKTSFMRRFAPDGVATTIVWGANVRTLRHVLSMRTDPGAEEEIRYVFDHVGAMMQTEVPNLMGDYERQDDGQWVTDNWKV